MGTGMSTGINKATDTGIDAQRHPEGDAQHPSAASSKNPPGADAQYQPAADIQHDPAADALHQPAANIQHNPADDAPHQSAANTQHDPADDAPHQPAADIQHDSAADAPHQPAGHSKHRPGADSPHQSAVVIVHHADGSAEVNGLPVPLSPGQDAREAAYLTAVALVSGSGPAPVAALRVEPDGTQYPFMLYPGRTVMAADPSATPRRAFASLMPNRLVVGACAFVFLAALAATLAVARVGGAAQAGAGSAIAAAPDTFAGGTAETAGADVARGIRSALTATRGSATRADASTSASSASSAKSDSRAAASSQSRGLHSGTGGPLTRPYAGAWPFDALHKHYNAPSLAVDDLTLAVVGGQMFDPDVAYVITVSTTSTNPFTLTYTYSGSRSSLRTTRRMVLSGQTEYTLSDTFPGDLFCGGTVTMRASTQPQSATGPVTETTTQEC